MTHQVPDYVKYHYTKPPARLPGPAYEGWQDPTAARSISVSYPDPHVSALKFVSLVPN
jgi:hypothetical protein